MFKASLSTFMLICLSLSVLTACSKSSQHANSNVEVNEPWARATFALAQTGAIYMGLTNTSEQAITLVSASVDESLAQDVQLHDMSMSGGMMQMGEIEGGLTIQAGETVAFEPGGKHIMLLGLTGPLNAEQQFEMLLKFEKIEALSVTVKVKDARNR